MMISISAAKLSFVIAEAVRESGDRLGQVRLNSQYFEAVRLCCQSQRPVMSGHQGIKAEGVVPEQGGCEVNCIKSSDFSRHGLRGAVENDVVNLNEFEGVNERKNRRTSHRDFGVGKISRAVGRDPRCADSRSSPTRSTRLARYRATRSTHSAVRVPRAAVLMSRRRQSSIALTFFKQNVKDLDFELR